MARTLALPLRVDAATGSFATVEQGGGDDLANQVAVIVATPEGSRVEVPEFGVPRMEFAPGGRPDPALIAAAVAEWTGGAVDLDVTVAAGLVSAADVTSSATLSRVRAQVTPHV